MGRKIIRAGNSFAVTIPPEIMEQLGVNVGSEVEITWDDEHQGALITPTKPTVQIDPEFAAMVDGFIDRYREALEELAKR